MPKKLMDVIWTIKDAHSSKSSGYALTKYASSTSEFWICVKKIRILHNEILVMRLENTHIPLKGMGLCLHETRLAFMDAILEIDV